MKIKAILNTTNFIFRIILYSSLGNRNVGRVMLTFHIFSDELYVQLKVFTLNLLNYFRIYAKMRTVFFFLYPFAIHSQCASECHRSFWIVSQIARVTSFMQRTTDANLPTFARKRPTFDRRENFSCMFTLASMG